MITDAERPMHSAVTERRAAMDGMLLLAVLVSLLSMIGCASNAAERNYGVSPRYAQARPGRVAVLVTRVGNERLHPMTEITGDFDYARTETGEIDVYVEEEKRLRTSIPDYPLLPCHVDLLLNNCAARQEMFANITPRLQATVESVLAARGFQVQNLRAIAGAWPNKLSSMKIRDIVAHARASADAVFVFHYRDYGGFAAGTRALGTAIGEGFTGLAYEGALFDTATGERLLAFGDRRFNVVLALASDPSLKGRVVKKGDSVTEVNIPLDEVVERALIYLRDGTTYQTDSGEQKVDGLVKLIP